MRLANLVYGHDPCVFNVLDTTYSIAIQYALDESTYPYKIGKDLILAETRYSVQ